MTEIIETAERYRVRLELMEDSAPCNPRTNSDTNLTNVITLPTQRYIDIDDDGGPLQHGWDHFADRHDGVDLFIRWARIFHGVVAIEDNPHDGARSIWYVMPDKAAESTWSSEKIIESEIEEYRKWAAGKVYGYVIERALIWVPLEGQDYDDDEPLPDPMTLWDTVEDCWGYIGYEYAVEEAKAAFALYKDKVEKEN